MFHCGVGFLLLTSSESFVGPFHYSPTATVGMLKEIIVSEWPKVLLFNVMSLDKNIVPKAASDIKFINDGKMLENGKIVAQCKAPFDDLPKSVIKMHVVVQPSPTKPRPGLILLLSHLKERKIEEEEASQRSFCSCIIM
ncbi:hypothetical protein HID58_007881 [Brassica napus]|uniref:UBL3-like ubiquitin domain-containing protein n=1 Tax=Brassica napus TaxID=3708 RepID=A0ABQ7XHP1_BRANA|nr:hypothetical protein HID58_007881 [Brassica napus]